jgi:hypothetical protein
MSSPLHVPDGDHWMRNILLLPQFDCPVRSVVPPFPAYVTGKIQLCRYGVNLDVSEAYGPPLLLIAFLHLSARRACACNRGRVVSGERGTHARSLLECLCLPRVCTPPPSPATRTAHKPIHLCLDYVFSSRRQNSALHTFIAPTSGNACSGRHPAMPLLRRTEYMQPSAYLIPKADESDQLHA